MLRYLTSFRPASLALSSAAAQPQPRSLLSSWLSAVLPPWSPSEELTETEYGALLAEAATGEAEAQAGGAAELASPLSASSAEEGDGSDADADRDGPAERGGDNFADEQQDDGGSAAAAAAAADYSGDGDADEEEPDEDDGGDDDDDVDSQGLQDEDDDGGDDAVSGGGDEDAVEGEEDAAAEDEDEPGLALGSSADEDGGLESDDTKDARRGKRGLSRSSQRRPAGSSGISSRPAASAAPRCRLRAADLPAASAPQPAKRSRRGGGG